MTLGMCTLAQSAHCTQGTFYMFAFSQKLINRALQILSILGKQYSYFQ